MEDVEIVRVLCRAKIVNYHVPTSEYQESNLYFEISL